MSFSSASVCRCCAALLVLVTISVFPASAQEKPEWNFEVIESEVMTFEVPSWHAKDYGWLMTARMRVVSQRLLHRLGRVRLEAWTYESVKEMEKAQEQGKTPQAIWSKTQLIYRKDFDGSLSGGSTQFLRMTLKDVPEEAKLITLSFENGNEG
ncbi:hypothetical protein [Pelagicoccus sp. SDUM812003]|uniref:hypothetical protein n=1 Tax=Pelagicoccus sp. SDUM812003 TaxID=3041267 RepID=UPI00280EA929|nr:hypothetical protein [Pelagicoccus sp. SDUM812003]MDQ8202668.1 hypothetical protein [Pelagicoccus sp. SDUM812003]